MGFNLKPQENHISTKIQQLLERKELVTAAEYAELRMNSWEFEAIVSRLDNDALIRVVGFRLNNVYCERTRPCKSYNEAVYLVYVPELLRRLKEK